MGGEEGLLVGIAQLTPVLLHREATLEKMLSYVRSGAEAGCRLLVFGEALLPGYPFWLERTDAARFDSEIQKDIHAMYMHEAVQPEAGHLQPLLEAAKQHGLSIYTGCIERAADRGGHSLYCSLLYIDSEGVLQSVHRKLMPTYEERLSWSPGDGHGLRVHRLGAFTAGGLNCWENWMPLARSALHGMGEDLHIAVWPGSRRNTEDISRFIAREARSYVISASGLMRSTDIPDTFPHAELLRSDDDEVFADGGSCIAGPDGQWVLEPVTGEEGLFTAEISHTRVREERQNFDLSGHYSRPDVLQLHVHRERQSVLRLRD